MFERGEGVGTSAGGTKLKGELVIELGCVFDVEGFGFEATFDEGVEFTVIGGSDGKLCLGKEEARGVFFDGGEFVEVIFGLFEHVDGYVASCDHVEGIGVCRIFGKKDVTLVYGGVDGGELVEVCSAWDRSEDDAVGREDAGFGFFGEAV